MTNLNPMREMLLFVCSKMFNSSSKLFGKAHWFISALQKSEVSLIFHFFKEITAYLSDNIIFTLSIWTDVSDELYRPISNCLLRGTDTLSRGGNYCQKGVASL